MQFNFGSLFFYFISLFPLHLGSYLSRENEELIDGGKEGTSKNQQQPYDYF